MLTADLALSWRRGSRISPRTLTVEDRQVLQTVQDLITLVGQHKECRRGDLDRALEEYVGTRTDYKVMRGLIKLLLDRCVFEATTAVDAAAIRRALFLKAREHHPISQSESLRQQLLAEVSQELGHPPTVLLENLYADLPENQRLVAFDEPTPRVLLEEYNLAQAQALLYRAVEMTVWLAPREAAAYRSLFEAIKSCRLIHTIRGQAKSGYEIRLSGPLSLFHRSQKYGIQMAVFLPALLACSGWRLQAEIGLKSGQRAVFELTSQQSRFHVEPLPASLSQNPWIEKLAADWSKRASAWTLESCQEVIAFGESAFAPDFVFRHPSGKQVYLEIVGFWTPRTLSERLKHFEHWGFKDFILAASQEWRCSREPPSDLPPNVIVFKTALDAQMIEDALGWVTSTLGDAAFKTD
jgi:hypothetical protein